MADVNEDAVSKEPPADKHERVVECNLDSVQQASSFTKAADGVVAGLPGSEEENSIEHVEGCVPGTSTASYIEGARTATPLELAFVPTPESGTERPKTKVGLLVLIKNKLVEKSDQIELVPRAKLIANSRRDFLIYGAGVSLSAAGLWWLLPGEMKQKLGFKTQNDSSKEDFLKKILSFDDEIAAGLFSSAKTVPVYRKADMTDVPNNYAGQTPDPSFISNWSLEVGGLAAGKNVILTHSQLLNDFEHHSDITRLVCVEGWSAITGWGGLRLADLIKRYPPIKGAKWIQLRSDVNLDSDGNSDPYFVALDLPSAIHPQTLLATHHNGKLLEIEHGAPLRLLAPMKLGLKNIKAITSINYFNNEPDDYWNKNGYSYYDGI